MPAYSYRAMSANGKEQSGLIEADAARQARQLLRDRGLMPIEVSETEQSPDGKASHSARTAENSSFRGRLSNADLALLTRQIATLTAASTPLAETLKIVSDQTEKPRHRALMIAVRSRVLEGYTFADALGEYPQAFPELYRATVSAGENSGTLDGVLEQLADYTEEAQAIQTTVKKALLYPSIIAFVAFAIVLFLMIYVVPNVVDVFAQQQRELPQPTQILLAVSSFTANYWWMVAIAVGIAVFVSRRLLRVDAIRMRWDRFILRLPLVGRLARASNAASFARTLAILTSSGVPLLNAMAVTSQVVINRPMRAAVAHCAERVREGGGLSAALQKTGLFPPMLLHMIASGEASGALADMLERGSRTQERELNSLVSTLLVILEPAIIVVMAVIVMAIVIAMMLPMLRMNELV